MTDTGIHVKHSAVAVIRLGVLVGCLCLSATAGGAAPRMKITVEGESFPVVVGDTLHPAPGWPAWLKDFTRGTRTEKTSGIAFAGRDSADDPCFFLADEVGFLHFCRVSGETGQPRIGLEPVRMDDTFMDDLALLARWDFEALTLAPALHDAAAAAVGTDEGRRKPLAAPLEGVLSVEGSRGHEAGRLEAVRFVRDAGGDSGPWRVLGLGEAIADAKFWSAFAGPDRGLKGIGESAGYLFMGLDNLGREGELRIAGSMLFLYSRARERATEVATSTYGIYSIGGIAAASDSVIVLVDYSRMCLDVLQWDFANGADIVRCHRFPLDLRGPAGFHYGIPNVEGIALDDRGDLWCVIDPIFGRYRAVDPALPESVSVYMEAGIPMLYRFAGAPVWEAVGVSAF